jgi:triphosphatase
MAAGDTTHASSEVELKLEFESHDAARIGAHPALAARASPPEERVLTSIYYDTEDDALHKAGVYLRVRERNGRFVQTIKASRAGLLDRSEWERELSGREPDLDAAKGTALEPLLTPGIRDALRPRFETRVRRKTYRIERGGSDIEVAIDQGEIVAGTLRRPISEVEFELKGGHTAGLFHLARSIAETVPLKLGMKTKAERGYELLACGDRAVEKAADIHVPPEMTSQDAFRAIAQNCLRQIVVNEPGMSAGKAESLHQMRIGLRRLRAALRFFTDLVADRDMEKIESELKWITQELGPARDLDIFAQEVLKPLHEAHPGDEGVAATYRDVEGKRDTAYARAKAAAETDRFRNAMLDFAEWMEVGAWSRADDSEREEMRDRPIADFARQELRSLRKRIRKRGKELHDLDVDQRHRLRITAKRLRYATEFFAATFSSEKGDKRRDDLLSALKDLQDALGGLNDLAAREALVAGSVSETVVAHLEAAKDDADKLLGDAEDAYAKIMATKAFWKG